ncbi:MAG TPA: prenyltransferase/squalene oxidase repeat-containing protein [Stellaceae bacterium]|nr:prenyltransferase/squalene oxidase repeat-containing protein [Stellaceae bacterium]
MAGKTGPARLAALLRLPYRYEPWRLRHIRLVLRDMAGGSRGPVCDDKTHLAAALDWLCLAQDVRDGECDAGGVSAGWSFEDGWLPSYPETTGYIIETFIDAAASLDRPDLIARAHRMIDWELTLQHPDGAFPGHYGEPGSKPVIFNTGQIMHGLLAGYFRLDRPECLAAAVRAGIWLAAQQDADGCWRRSQHNGIPHTYDTRASWALLHTGMAAQEPKLQSAARRQLDWALQQQDNDGWFANNAFTADAAPFTHTIAYAVAGFLHSGLLLGDERYLAAARKAARALAKLQRSDGWLAGAYGRNWVREASYCCLTGVAQTAIVWAILAQSCGETEFMDPARRALLYLKGRHRVTAGDAVIRGGIAGSYPIWGAYERFYYPAWATKFFADAVMLIGALRDERADDVQPRAASYR